MTISPPADVVEVDLRTEFGHGLHELADDSCAGSAGHEEVFSRSFGAWAWVGWYQGRNEFVHAWRHPEGAWALLPVPRRITMSVDPETKTFAARTFGAANSQARRDYLTWAHLDVVHGVSFEDLADSLMVQIEVPDAYRVFYTLAVERLRGLLTLPVTDDERAVAVIYALLLPSR